MAKFEYKDTTIVQTRELEAKSVALLSAVSAMATTVACLSVPHPTKYIVRSVPHHTTTVVQVTVCNEEKTLAMIHYWYQFGHWTLYHLCPYDVYVQLTEALGVTDDNVDPGVNESQAIRQMNYNYLYFAVEAEQEGRV